VKNLSRLRLSHGARIAISKRKSLFSHAKTTGRSADFKEFRIAAKQASVLVRRDHWKVIDDVASRRRDYSRRFWNLLKQQSDNTGVPPLRVDEDHYVVGWHGKAELLNNYFSSVYSKGDQPKSPVGI